MQEPWTIKFVLKPIKFNRINFLQMILELQQEETAEREAQRDSYYFIIKRAQLLWMFTTN